MDIKGGRGGRGAEGLPSHCTTSGRRSLGADLNCKQFLQSQAAAGPNKDHGRQTECHRALTCRPLGRRGCTSCPHGRRLAVCCTWRWPHPRHTLAAAWSFQARKSGMVPLSWSNSTENPRLGTGLILVPAAADEGEDWLAFGHEGEVVKELILVSSHRRWSEDGGSRKGSPHSLLSLVLHTEN